MTKTCAIVSFRLGGNDGVAVIARTWERALQTLGWRVITVAGDSPASYELDVQVEGLGLESTMPVDMSALAGSVADADLLLCENILALPLNPAATESILQLSTTLPIIAHHHDFPWQLERYRHIDYSVPKSDQIHHVVINQQSVDELSSRGIAADLIYNSFDTAPPPGDRRRERTRQAFEENELIVVHPSRAIRRKNIPAAIRLAEQLEGTYWLTGPAENEYDAELAELLGAAACRVVHRPASSASDLYAAGDLVVFPSIWEGFGNPPIEAALFRRPAAVGHYPVSHELRRLGFEWLDPSDADSIRQTLQSDHTEMLRHNAALATAHFSFERLVSDIENLLSSIFS